MKQTHFSVLVVSFNSAMAVFFAVPNEPPFWVPLALLLLAASWLEFAGKRDAYRLMRLGLVLLVFAIGFSWAQFRTHCHRWARPAPQKLVRRSARARLHQIHHAGGLP